MKIKKLALTNFRTFQECQTIEFSPITLLFGPNSVGKSTVLVALFYLQQIIENGNCNPERLEALGDKYIGGFKKLIHKNNIKDSMIIKLTFDKDNRIGSSYGFIEDLFEDYITGITSPSELSEEMSIEFEIAWSTAENTAYISRYTIAFDGENIAEVTSDSGLKQPIISAINYLHPLLIPDNHNEWLLNCIDEGSTIHEALKIKALDIKKNKNPDYRAISKGNDYEDEDEGEDEDISLSNDAFVSEFHQLLNEPRIADNATTTSTESVLTDEFSFASYKTIHVPIALESHSGALPYIGKKLTVSLMLEDTRLNERAIEILSDLVVAPLDNLYDLLKDSLCIGPLRTIPDALFQSNANINQKDWYDGSASWHTLAKIDINLLQTVNFWLSDHSKLNLGYGIALHAEKTFSEIKRISKHISKENLKARLDTEIISSYEHDSSTTRYQLDLINNKLKYSLWDINNDISVEPNEIGVGISQLMPLVVASLSRKQGLIACEQPELHVHPRVQVAIGDLLLQSNDKINFLIETHSEHLILRLLRRIREINEKKLPSDFNEISTKDLSVIYIEPSPSGAKVRRINVTEDGDFNEAWPGGFFDERDEELF